MIKNLNKNEQCAVTGGFTLSAQEANILHKVTDIFNSAGTLTIFIATAFAWRSMASAGPLKQEHPNLACILEGSLVYGVTKLGAEGLTNLLFGQKKI